MSIVDSWNTSLAFRSEGQSLVSCFNSHTPHTFSLSSGHSFSECFFLHLGQSTPSTRSSATCLCFALITSNCEEMELIMSVLKFSRRFPIYARVAPLLANLCACEKMSKSFVPVRVNPLEYHRHKSTMWSKDSLDISPFPNKLSMSKQPSLIPRSRLIWRTSLP